MAVRMSVAVTPRDAETPSLDAETDAPKVQVLLTVVAGADLNAALAVVDRQVYEPSPDIVVVGDVEDAGDHPVVGTLEQAIRDADESVDYFWILHSDARPRPDALGALVSELGRNEASLGGSKLLVAGTPDQLESVGSATDVFGEPYSGLDEGEIDLQQYDVVREVAFVRSASMLVRRDLAQGLRGLDMLLPPISAGLDFSQRSRLAGGRVISVPSSEVYHQGRCNERPGGWKEQAGRRRAMLTAYSPLTLAWVVPYDMLVSFADSLANLLLGRWRPAARHAFAWLWNAYHLPSTIRLRMRNRKIRVSGDEELFRFQARGSVRLREVGAELTAKLLGLFDDDQVLARGAKRVWSAPGIWGALVAFVVALVAARSIIFGGVPAVGGAHPFEPPLVALDRWLGGWNDSGLGSPAPVHPSTLVTAVLSTIFFGALGAARTLFTLATVLIGVVGMGRLGGRLGLRGPGRYVAGIVLMAGPGTALVTGAGSWTALGAAALLPWFVRAVLVPADDRRGPGSYGWALVFGVIVAAFVPVLVVLPLLLVPLLSSGVRPGRRLLVGLSGLVAGVIALPFALGDPGWFIDEARRLGLAPNRTWVVAIAVAGAVTVLLAERWRRVAATGTVLALASLLALSFPVGGPATEEALLIAASLGAALVTAAGLDLLAAEPLRILASLAALSLIALSLGPLSNGRYGLPAGDLGNRYGFGVALAGEDGPGRLLVVSADRSLVPGEARPGPGLWYRVVDASGMTHDEVWLPAPLEGDRELESALTAVVSGAELRPGAMLADFAIDWVVIEGEETTLDEVLVGQLDLLPTPLLGGARVYDNMSGQPLAAGSTGAWSRSGAGFTGPEASQVRLALNHDWRWAPGAQPDGWSLVVDGSSGRTDYSSAPAAVALSLAGPVVAVLGVVLIALGRRQR
jgi:GT2 family glycosyltransferase